MENGKILSTSNKILAIELQNKEVIPSTERQVITADEGYIGLDKVNVNAVTSDIDSNIKPENIREDVEILGVKGTMESGEEVANALVERTLTSIVSNATSVADLAFYQYKNLQSITLPNAKDIGISAFNSCSNLQSITLPNVTGIGNNAFYNCSSCQLFDFRGATKVPVLVTTYAFTNTPSTKKIVVPDSLYATWKKSTNWSSSQNYIVSSIIKASDYEASL